jgi:hypothetical protein
VVVVVVVVVVKDRRRERQGDWKLVVGEGGFICVVWAASGYRDCASRDANNELVMFDPVRSNALCV